MVVRKDFERLLHEVYRHDNGITNSKIRSKIKNSKNDEDGDFYSTAVNKKKYLSWNRKKPEFNYKPIYNFLKSQVGKNWDKVYSEICNNITKRPDLIERVLYSIATKVEKRDDGTIYIIIDRQRELYYDECYVDPDTNLVCQYKKRSSRRYGSYHKKTIPRIEVSITEFLEPVDGIWYRFIWEPLPNESTILKRKLANGLTKNYIRYDTRYCNYNKRHVSLPHDEYYCSQKKQLSSEELKKFGVANDNSDAD